MNEEVEYAFLSPIARCNEKIEMSFEDVSQLILNLEHVLSKIHNGTLCQEVVLVDGWMSHCISC